MTKELKISLVMKDQLLRYSISNQSSLEGVLDYGELFLKEGTVQDGEVIEEADFQNVLQKLLAEKNLENNPLYFCIPDSFVIIRECFVPSNMEKAEIKRYINTEMKDELHLPFANPAIDLVITGEVNNKAKVLLFAYPKEKIVNYFQSFKRAGLQPVVADLNSLSLYRLYQQLIPNQAQDHLLSVHWGRDSIVLTAFHYHKPLFTRRIKLPLSGHLWRINEQYNEHEWTGSRQEMEEMIQEQLLLIERVMDFYKHFVMKGNGQINKILLTGDFPYMDKSKYLLEKRHSIFIEALEDLPNQFGFPSKYADVLGLALKK